MAVRIQLRRDTAANWTSNNPVLRQGEIGIETDTFKMKVGNGSSTWAQITQYMNIVPDGNLTIDDYIPTSDIGAENGVVGLSSSNAIIPGSSIILEGSTANSHETTLTVTDPTEDRTITFPNATGTVALAENVAALSGATFTGNISVPTAITFEGATANDFETTIQVTDPTADRTITIPDVGGTLVTTGDTGSVTNTMLAGSIANDKLAGSIANDKLSNSAITINGTSTSLGGSRTLGTDDVSEGTTNKYFTDERAQDAIATAIAAGTHTNITITYDDSTNKFTFVGANTYSDENAQDAIGNAVGTGLSYNDTTGAISVDTATIQARVTDVSDTEIGYLNGVTSAIQTQIDSKFATANASTTNISEGTNQYFTVERAQDAVGEAVGTGLSYNDTTGAISVDTTAIQAKVANVDDTEIGYLNGVTSGIQTQIDNKAPIASPTFTGTVTLAADPASALQAATKQYVDNTASGIVAKPQVLGATTANIDATYNNGTAGVGATLTHNTNGALPSTSGGATGWAVGKGILVKNQTNKAQNGRYYVSNMGSPSTPYVLTRCGYCDEASEIPGAYIFVQDGTNAGTGWIQTVADAATFVVGTDDINVYQFSGSGTYTAGTGLTLTGNEYSINTSVTADLSTAQTLTNKTLTSPVINTPTGITKSDVGLANVDNTTDAGKPISTATQTALDLKLASATAATTYAPLASPTFTGTVTLPSGTVTSTMIADGTIADADINASAAIALSKLATDPLARANHTGSQAASTISDFNEAAQDAIGNAVGTGLSYNDTTGAVSVTTNTYDAYGSASTVAGNLSTHESDTTTHGTTGNIVGTSDTQTLTNKTLTSPKINEDVAVTATATELNYVDGVTSAIQTQLDGKVDESLFDTKGDILVASADNTPAKLAAGTNGYLLTANSGATNGIEWAAAPVSLPSQTGNSGKYLTTDGTDATWGTLVVPIVTGTDTVTGNTVETVDTTALSAFTSIEYMVSLKQATNNKTRTSKVIVQTDGTSVDMTEFAITETGGTIAGVVVSAAVSSTNAVLQVTVTDAATNNVTVKFSKVSL
jgi:hypothetical protein